MPKSHAPHGRWPEGEAARPWPQFGGIDERIGAVEVDGCEIRYRHVMREGAPTVVLIHGGSAHSGWWAATAVHLASAYDLVLPDLSGHGDSGHRPGYDPEAWAAELAGVISDCGRRHAFIVGHSIGGLVGVYLAASAPATVAGLVFVDTRLKPPSVAPTPVTERGDGRGQHWVYETKQQGIARFRLVPADTMADPATLHFLAEEGLRPVADGWTWKSDPNALRRFTDEAVRDRLARWRARLAMCLASAACLVDFAPPSTWSNASVDLSRYVPSQVHFITCRLTRRSSVRQRSKTSSRAFRRRVAGSDSTPAAQ